jgi:quercetin dioxygenase-like cupin family protein
VQLIRHDPVETPVMPTMPTPVVTGTVRLQQLVSAAQTEQLRVLYVHFEAGGANLLHTHTFDQILYIVEGEGIVATETEEYRVRPGDIVVVPAGERHWHGATPKTAMAHLAIGVPGTTDVGGQIVRATE